MTDNKYCDIKRYLKNEHNEYYRLLKDKLCSDHLFSNLPKCFLIPNEKLLKKLKAIKSGEELSKHVQRLILKSNIHLEKISSDHILQNIANYQIDNTKQLLDNITRLSDGSVYKVWSNSTKKEDKINTAYLYKGDDVPQASKLLTRDDKKKSTSKSKRSSKGGAFENSNKFSTLINIMNGSVKKDTITEQCLQTQNMILCKMCCMSEFYLNRFKDLMLFAYYKDDPIISLLCIVRALTSEELNEIKNFKSEKYNACLQNAPSCFYTEKVKNGIAGLINITKTIKNDENDQSLAWDRCCKKLENEYKKISENSTISWHDKLLFDEIKSIYSNHSDSAVGKFRAIFSIVLSTFNNIIYFSELGNIELLKSNLNKTMENFINSQYYLYIPPIGGGGVDVHNNILKSLKAQHKKLNELIEELEHKHGKGITEGGDIEGGKNVHHMDSIESNLNLSGGKSKRKKNKYSDALGWGRDSSDDDDDEDDD